MFYCAAEKEIPCQQFFLAKLDSDNAFLLGEALNLCWIDSLEVTWWMESVAKIIRMRILPWLFCVRGRIREACGGVQSGKRPRLRRHSRVGSNAGSLGLAGRRSMQPAWQTTEGPPPERSETTPRAPLCVIALTLSTHGFQRDRWFSDLTHSHDKSLPTDWSNKSN